MNDEIDDVNGSMRAIDGTFWLLPHKRFRTDGRAQGLPREPLHRLIDGLIAELALVRSADLREVLVTLRKARSQLDRAEYEAVAVARSNQWAWRDVADVLQVAVSSVHKRFARGTALPRWRPG
jgi:DNA-directed RNA polymerase specialized sigma24 family protein